MGSPKCSCSELSLFTPNSGRADEGPVLTVLWENTPTDPALEALLHRVFSTACGFTKTDLPIEVSVKLTNDVRLRELNHTYRKVDAPTDVLSFPQRQDPAEGAGFTLAPWAGEAYLGDIAISVPRVKAQATALGHCEERELAYLFVHGFLHLLGHAHADETAYRQMREQEESILLAAQLPRQTCETARDYPDPPNC